MMYVSGRTGMGKSKFIQEVIRKLVMEYPQYNVYHIDTKKDDKTFSAADGLMISSLAPPDAYTTPGHSIVWKPQRDDKDIYSRFFESILAANLPAIVDIDECINFRFAGDQVPRGLEILIAQARSRGIWVIGGTQRVARSPSYLRTQATYVVSFDIAGKYDIATMADDLGLEGKRKNLQLRKYQLWMLDKDVETVARKFNSYKDALKFIH